MNRKLLIFSFVLVYFQVFSQQSEFEKINLKIESLAKQNLWDDILLIAPDLILEEPMKGDGYYYTAMAFYKIGIDDKANKYIGKAKLLADDELMKRIIQLEKEMNLKDELNDLVSKAMSLDLTGYKKREAAETWLKAWEIDKYKIEYALNAVSYYIDLKDYIKALEILNQPLVYQDGQVKELIKKINNTSEMKSYKGYNQAIKDGDFYFDHKEFSTAKKYYEKALIFNSNDPYSLDQIEIIVEELTWESAKKSHYVQDTEKYADKYPNGKYIDSANSLIKRSYLSIAKNAFNSSNESQMVEFYNKYLNRFPRDDGISNIRDLLLRYYLEEGNSNLAAKDWYDAKKYFQAYLNILSYGINADHCRKSIKKCEWKLNQRSASFLMYTYDSESPIGISIGNINKNKAGYYLNLKMNPEIFTGFDVLWTIDNQGNSDSPWDIDPTGEIKNGNISLSGGVTFKIAYPLWGYIGGGIGYFPQYEEVDEYDNSGDLYETVWMRNTDETSFRFFPEGGFKLKISNALVLKYGIMYREVLIHQFGFGFQL